MDAGKKNLLDLFTGSLRFVVPVYQRRYSWGEAQCRQLWADIVTAGRHPDRTHFIGSIVWMQEGGIGPDGVSRCLLIDGQQRLTSVTLLLIALAEYAREHPESLRFSVVPEFLRTLVFARPRGDDQFADCTFSPSLDMSR